MVIGKVYTIIDWKCDIIRKPDKVKFTLLPDYDTLNILLK